MNNRKRIKKSLCLIGASLIALQLAGCTSRPVYYQLLTSEEINDFPAGSKTYAIAENDLADMQVAAEDGKAVLYYNPKTTEIAVARKDTGKIWYSNPQDRLSSTDSLANAQIIVTTLNRRDTAKRWDTYTDSVVYGQFSAEEIENGIAVTYLMGKKPEDILYPQGLTVARYDEIMQALPGDSEKGYIKRLYGYVEYDTIDSVQTKEDLRAKFDNVIELNTMYSLKSNMSKLEKSHLTETLQTIGYTAEMRMEDDALVGFEEENKSENFTISVSYTLENGALCVDVDPAQIRSTEGLKISQISVLRNFGARKPGESGHLFVPDGSGAIIDTDTPVATTWGEYDRHVYGQDLGVLRTDRTEYSEQLYLPVFGAYGTEGGFIGVAEKDDGQMSVVAGKADTGENYSYVYPDFLLLTYSLVTIESSSINALNIYPRKAVTDPIRVRYLFSDDKDTDYDDLAVLYRDYMTARGQLDGENDKKGVPVMANAVGAIDDIRSILGYPIKVIKPLTDFSDISELAKGLKQGAVNGDVVIGYTGWLSGGIKTGYIKKAKIEGKLGSGKEFTQVAAELKAEGVTLMPVVEQQYCYNGKWYQGFRPLTDAIRFITRDTGYKPEHNIANYYLDADGLKPYIIRPYLVEENASAFVASIEKYDLGALSVGSMARELYSDFYMKRILSTNDTIGYFQDTLDVYKQAGYVLGGCGANAYTLYDLDYTYGLPVSASNHPIIEKSVPFLQIVLSGSVSYTMPPLDMQADPGMYLLKAIETGSGVYFDYFAADGSAIKGTQYDGYYAASRDSIYDLGLTIGREVSDALAPVANQKIVSHKEIAGGVFVTAYENGVSVGVNYTDEAYGNIPAHGYAVIGY
jgi:hypothetical protein